MAEIYKRVLDGFTMPVEWPPRIVVPIFKGKGGVMHCRCNGVVKLHEHGIKVGLSKEDAICRVK